MRIVIMLGLSLLGLVAWTVSESTASPAPLERADSSWVAVSGTVAALGERSFELDYGGRLITVELDGWQLDGDARYGLMQGGKILVTANLSRSFRDRRRVSATSLYLERRGVLLYASGHSETDFDPVVPVDAPSRVTFVGTVRGVTDWRFSVETSAGVVEVDTRSMPRAHLDELDYENLRVGERIRVSGLLSDRVFEGSLEAQAMARLR